MSHHETVPADIAKTQSPLGLLREAVASAILELPSNQPLVRAARNPAATWPVVVSRTGRFGPPQCVADTFWIYVADDVLTAVWEGRFCNKVATKPGRFAISDIARHGVIAHLSFDEPLKFFDLSGDVASKLGIYDELRSPDYDWCQWFGYAMDKIVEEYQGVVHGFAYPSRRHPGEKAYVISSRVRAALETKLTVYTQRFIDTAAYAELTGDPCYLSPDSV